MNVAMAMEEAEDEGIVVKKVVANDDVPSAPKGQEAKRRGVAGEILMWKVGGAKAAMGGNLDEVIAALKKPLTIPEVWELGFAPCAIPEVGHPNFTIEEGKMEVGIGHHGEPGIEVAIWNLQQKLPNVFAMLFCLIFRLKKEMKWLC